MRCSLGTQLARTFVASVLVAFGSHVSAQTGLAAKIIDVADLTPGVDAFTRVTGAGFGPGLGLGFLGVPVAGGGDLDGDGFEDTAFGHLLESPLGRFLAGEASIVFGNGTIGEALDLGASDPRVLDIFGEGNFGVFEALGSELWMGDVTGDDLADLLVCRQNYSFDPGTGPRIGAGALTIIVGSPALRDLAAAGQPLDLANPPLDITLVTIVGASDFDRLGMWVRVGDVDGDGTDDVLVAADQESDSVETHHGALYVVRGGAHLGTSALIDLAEFGATSLAGKIARITPPTGSDEYHFGSTCQLGDLNGNGRAEIFGAAGLNRAGAIVGPFDFSAHATGGPIGGAVFIVWDDNFPSDAWPAGLQIDMDTSRGSLTRIDGGVQNAAFGEELLGGLDYDGDGNAELFIGDLTGDGTADQSRPEAGVGYVFFEARLLKGMSFNIDEAIRGDARLHELRVTKIIGPEAGAIGADTATQGDFDGDGLGDLVVGSPTANPQGRGHAGVLHVLFGRTGGWPFAVDLAPGSIPSRSRIRLTEVQGANGDTASEFGDVLCYSAAAGDLDGDGRTDLITNEMRGNGLDPGSADAGNLVIFPGAMLSPSGAFDGRRATKARRAGLVLRRAEHGRRTATDARRR